MKSLKNGQYEYQQSDFLGEGSFAKVYKGVIVKTQRVIAVRLLSLKLIKQFGNKIKSIINQEVCVLKQLSEIVEPDCLFTTRIFDCFLTQHNVVMILEFCPDGNLQDVVSKRGPIPQHEAMEIAYQLARGLQFIARRKVVHRDIKPDNVFNKKELGHMIYKLGDFGFAVKKQINQDIVGTPIFMSPELFRQEPYGSEVDVWAYGLLVHYILFKQHYFMDATQNKVKNRVLNQRYNLTQKHMSAISPNVANLLTGCLQYDKHKRLRAETLAEHPSFNHVRERVDKLVLKIEKNSHLVQSQLRKSTAKGQYYSFIMSFNFIHEVAIYLGKKNNSNLASLYLLKYCLSQLTQVKRLAEQRQNIINHPEWPNFIQTPQFNGSFKLIDNVLGQVQKAFEYYYSKLMSMLSQQHPQIAQGITSNLGSSPIAPINPDIPMYELQNSWLNNLGNSPQEYFTKIEIMVVINLLQKKYMQIDFTAVEYMKKSATMQQMVSMFEKALQASQMSGL